MSFQEHIFIDESALYRSSQKDLSLFVYIGKTFLQYIYYQAKTKQVLYLSHIHTINSSINESHLEEVLNCSLYQNVDEVYITFDGIKHILVPLPIYSNKHHLSYFKHIHNIENDELIMTQLPRENLIELFVIKEKSKKLINNKFSNVHILNLSACLLSQYFEVIKNNFNLQNILFLFCSEDTLYLTLFQHKELIYHFSFDIESPQDILYNLLNLVQNKNVKLQESHFILSGFNSKQNEIADLLNEYFPIETFEQSMLKNNTFNNYNDFPIHILFNVYSIIKCVS